MQYLQSLPVWPQLSVTTSRMEEQVRSYIHVLSLGVPLIGRQSKHDVTRALANPSYTPV